jgi:hypothetical protein
VTRRLASGPVFEPLTPDPRLPHHPGIDRRRFRLTSLAGVIAAPLAAEAGKVYRLGILSPSRAGPQPRV